MERFRYFGHSLFFSRSLIIGVSRVSVSRLMSDVSSQFSLDYRDEIVPHKPVPVRVRVSYGKAFAVCFQLFSYTT